MKIHCFVLFLLAFGFVFTACDNCSDTVDAPVTPPMRFSIVDVNGDNLVDSTQSSYLADSIKLFDLENKEWIVLDKEYLPVADGFVFLANFRKNPSGKTSLILHLSSKDSDTLDAWYKQSDNKCFILYEYTRFQHNGREVQKSPLYPALLITKAN
jgi:hypothetical protein